MDITFWFGIGLGALLSLLASIIANLFNYKINTFWDNQRAKLSFKREEKEKRTFELVHDLHSGKRDKIIYFIVRSTSITGILILSLTVGAMSIYGAAKFSQPLYTADDSGDLGFYARKAFPFICLVVFLVGSYSSTFSLRRLRDLANKLDSFERYKEELSERFPQSDFWKA